MSEYEHIHKYFIFQVKTEFEEVQVRLSPNLSESYYNKTEYATLGCACGHVIKKQVVHT